MTVSDEDLKLIIDLGKRTGKNWTTMDMATELLARRDADRWIPVEERLPEWLEQVYFGDFSSPYPEKFTYGTGYFYSEDGYVGMTSKPTHWRPLPAPPEVIHD